MREGGRGRGGRRTLVSQGEEKVLVLGTPAEVTGFGGGGCLGKGEDGRRKGGKSDEKEYGGSRVGRRLGEVYFWGRITLYCKVRRGECV
ncbi:hypothetical protein E2C01_070321 [Portunus trituberculatus]|uniref:Uncharacterized protein n=1 Tax=Portunus trituberculatus TaxID=210409 RepID=A0A5B7HSD7_PORTR|nr:hypothetical protein [Portunus trituberculatus]